MPANLDIPTNRLAEFCRKWQVAELSLFGSVLRDDFGPESDVDVLVRFAPGARPSLFTFAQMQDELAQVLGRRIDLVSKEAIEDSTNPYRRSEILRSAKVVYAA